MLAYTTDCCDKCQHLGQQQLFVGHISSLQQLFVYLFKIRMIENLEGQPILAFRRNSNLNRKFSGTVAVHDL